MKTLVAFSAVLTSLTWANLAVAETNLSIDFGPVVGRAHDVRPIGGTSGLGESQLMAGFLARVGAVGTYFEAGATMSLGGTFFGPSTFAAGAYAGPSFAPLRSIRLSVAGELGIQVHNGFGDEFWGSADSADVTLPYAGGSAAMWLNGSATGTSSVSFGLYGGARYDLGRGTGHAVVTPSSFCFGVIECLLTSNSPPQPFTQDYDVGGHEVYAGFIVRLNPRPAPQRPADPPRGDARGEDAPGEDARGEDATQPPSAARWR